MTWVVWRQARTQLIAGLGVLLALGAFVAWTRHSITSYADTSGLNACLSSDGDCSDLVQAFNDKFRTVFDSIGYLNFLPLLVGLFWGAPLLAREFESGTYRLAWTQSVTRRRWLSVRLLVLMAASVTAAVALSVLLTWLFRVILAAQSDGGGFGDTHTRWDPNVYDFYGLAPVGFTLFAVAIGVAAGAVFRRVLVAMAITVAVWLPLRLWMESARDHLFAPLQASFPLGAYPSIDGAWVLSSTLVGPDGAAAVPASVVAACGPLDKRALADSCLGEHGFRQVATYQPASRFWDLQLVEFAIFGGAALVLLALTYFWVTRHSAG